MEPSSACAGFSSPPGGWILARTAGRVGSDSHSLFWSLSGARGLGAYVADASFLLSVLLGEDGLN